MEDPTAIRREMDGKPAYQPNDRGRKKTHRQKPAGRKQEPARSKQPRASQRASVAAQDWYDRGESHGLTFPYDVNYLALALQRKVERDPKMSPLLADGNKVDRWLAKMVANWWGHYVDGSIHGGNAKEMFLGEDWDDVRDWAHSNLRKDYVLKHGTKVQPSINPNSATFRDRLKEIHTEAQVQRYVDSQPEVGESPPLDETGRERLRSFANRRRRRKK
jgi:hypothetical protein